jgi:hypothetical protein
MKRLSEVHDVPQIVVEWKTNSTGLPAMLPARSTEADILGIYGQLLDTVALFLFEAPLCERGAPLSNQTVRALQNETSRLAAITNTRFSDVRFLLEPAEVRDLLGSLSKVIPRMEKASYFTKGKPDKTLAEYAINTSRGQYVQMPDGKVRPTTPAQLGAIIERVMALPKFQKPTLCFYTGYKWRSDPHCGVLVSLDYRLCRAPGERLPQDRSTGLVVIYPRVSLSSESATWQGLKRLGIERPAALRQLFTQRYGDEADEKIRMCLSSHNLFAVWNNSTKQARLFRRYADIVVLNDGLVLGESLSHAFS